MATEALGARDDDAVAQREYLAFGKRMPARFGGQRHARDQRHLLLAVAFMLDREPGNVEARRLARAAARQAMLNDARRAILKSFALWAGVPVTSQGAGAQFGKG